MIDIYYNNTIVHAMFNNKIRKGIFCLAKHTIISKNQQLTTIHTNEFILEMVWLFQCCNAGIT